MTTPTAQFHPRASTLSPFAAAPAVGLVFVAVLVLPGSAAAQSKAASLVNKAVACACFKGGELTIDKGRSLADSDCTCPYADRIRKDVAAAVGNLAVSTKQERAKIVIALEEKFLTASPDYERLLRYDADSYRWFLQNVRCVCEGCKATVYFSNCQLACTPSVVYKRRARLFLALGFVTDDVIDYYLSEYNATHSAREQITREWLLPKRQRKRGWMVPAMLILGAILLLGTMLKRIVGRSNAPVMAATGTAANGADSSAAEPMSDDDRDLVLDALDDLDE